MGICWGKRGKIFESGKTGGVDFEILRRGKGVKRKDCGRLPRIAKYLA